MFLKALNLRSLALPSGLPLFIGDRLVSKEISKSSQLASVGSTVEVGFDYLGLACIKRDAQKF